jgi:hypothetical protein
MRITAEKAGALEGRLEVGERVRARALEAENAPEERRMLQHRNNVAKLFVH